MHLKWQSMEPTWSVTLYVPEVTSLDQLNESMQIDMGICCNATMLNLMISSHVELGVEVNLCRFMNTV